MGAKDEHIASEDVQNTDSEGNMQETPQEAAFSESVEESATHDIHDTAEEADRPEAEQPSELDELRRQLEEQQERTLRLQAEFDNFRRRSRLEKEDYLKYASSDIVEKLLPVLDNFDRALSSAQGGNDYDALVKGVDMIFRQFKQVLEQSGLSTMDAAGQPFNPEYHEAVMKEETEDQEEGIVLEELQKGYLFKDKVLRPAMVKVSG